MAARAGSARVIGSRRACGILEAVYIAQILTVGQTMLELIFDEAYFTAIDVGIGAAIWLVALVLPFRKLDAPLEFRWDLIGYAGSAFFGLTIVMALEEPILDWSIAHTTDWRSAFEALPWYVRLSAYLLGASTPTLRSALARACVAPFAAVFVFPLGLARRTRAYRDSHRADDARVRVLSGSRVILGRIAAQRVPDRQSALSSLQSLGALCEAARVRADHAPDAFRASQQQAGICR
jgi:hypothetical protein